MRAKDTCPGVEIVRNEHGDRFLHLPWLTTCEQVTWLNATYLRVRWDADLAVTVYIRNHDKWGYEERERLAIVSKGL